MLSAWDLLIEIYSQKIKTTACLLLEIVLDFIFHYNMAYVKNDKKTEYLNHFACFGTFSRCLFYFKTIRITKLEL